MYMKNGTALLIIRKWKLHLSYIFYRILATYFSTECTVLSYPSAKTCQLINNIIGMY